MSQLEDAFARLWSLTYGTRHAPERQHQFDTEADRLWRFDFAWPAERVAVEIDGGVFVRGGHNRGMRMTQDHEKQNAAVVQGWAVLRYTTLDLRKRPVQVIDEVARLIAMKRGKELE